MKALQPIFRRVQKRPIPALVGILVVLFAIFLAILISGDPTWAYRLFGATEKFPILEFIGVAMGGVLLAVGLVIAHRRATAMVDAANAQAEAAKAHAEANRGAEDGRRQDRLKNAIEHLGHDSDSVRLGGAYELFHLAKDTEELRQTVLDILCAHVRGTTWDEEYRDKYKIKPSEEIQNLLTLLFVEEHDVFRGCRVHLQMSWLTGANLDRSRLPNANFSLAYLQKSSFFGARLQGVNFSHSHMESSCLCDAKLHGANLDGADMQGANFLQAHMQGAKLHQAQFQAADLSKASLQGTVSQLELASSFQAHIRGRIGMMSDISEATFRGGLSRERVVELVSNVPGVAAEELQQELEPHIGQPASHELPEDSGAIVGAYTAEEAEEWIAEYEKAVGKNPKTGA